MNTSNSTPAPQGSGESGAWRRYLFLTIYGIVKYIPTPIGDVLRWMVLKCFMKKLASKWIHEGVTIHHPQNVSVGNSALNEFVFINGWGEVTIGDQCLIGHQVTIFSAEHGSEGREPIWAQEIAGKPIIIEDGVYLGARSVILGDVTIGQGAVIAAGAVVTKDIPPFAIASGVPARVNRYRGNQDGDA